MGCSSTLRGSPSTIILLGCPGSEGGGGGQWESASLRGLSTFPIVLPACRRLEMKGYLKFQTQTLLMLGHSSGGCKSKIKVISIFNVY